MLKKTRYESYLFGHLPEGCRLCVTGEKSVLFVTGVCSQNCYYCSLSDNKKNKDKTIINEWETENIKEVIEEIKLCDSKGAGITGGDPLARLEKSVRLIKQLKKEFGQKFHLHLYTPLKLVNAKTLKSLYDAGLDEIRFHPDVDDDKYWKNIRIAKEFNWDVGVEIPSLPHKLEKTKSMINYISPYIDFLNINELEISDNNFQDFAGLNLKTKDKMSYAIEKSLSIGKKIAGHAQKSGIKNIHICTATLKDKYQLTRRIKRRAKNAHKDYDVVTKEGMLIRGAIYFDKKKVSDANYDKIISLMDELGVPENLIDIDKERKRILTRMDVVTKLKDILKKNKLKPAIVEEYPTHDCFSVEADYL